MCCKNCCCRCFCPQCRTPLKVGMLVKFSEEYMKTFASACGHERFHVLKIDEREGSNRLIHLCNLKAFDELWLEEAK